MKKYCITFFCLWMCIFAQGGGAAGAPHYALERAHLSANDMGSVRRGARYFAQNCMVCHSMKYLRYNKLAQEEGVVFEKMPVNNREWAGTPPPDLSLSGQIRGGAWLYTYFHSFYEDTKAPLGSNNLLVPNTSMPNVFAGIQGTQVFIGKPHATKSPVIHSVLRLTSQGSMSPEEFNRLTRDVTNYLLYAADPHVKERKEIGLYVLIALFLFSILTYLLKKEYWRDIK